MTGSAGYALLFGLGAALQAVLFSRRRPNARLFLYSLLFGLTAFPLAFAFAPASALPARLFLFFLLFIAAFARLFRETILPRVNEGTLLVYHLLLLYSVFAFVPAPGRFNPGLGAALGAATLGVLWLAFTGRAPSRALKGLVYTWYMLTAAAIGFLQFSAGSLRPFFGGEVPACGSFFAPILAGMAFCYVLVNAVCFLSVYAAPVLFTGRRPGETAAEHNLRLSASVRAGGGKIAEEFVDAAQITPALALLVIAGLGGALAANHFFGLVSAPTAVSLGLLLPMLLTPPAEAEPAFTRAIGDLPAEDKEFLKLFEAYPESGAAWADPKYAKAYAVRGARHLAEGNYEAAVTDCSRAIALAPGNAEAYRVRAQAYRKSGAPDKALADEAKFESLSSAQPKPGR